MDEASTAGDATWHGERPLHNPIDVARLGEIYSRTAAFYDGLVAEHQARAKLSALEVLNRRPGESFLEVGVGTAWAFEKVIDASGPDRTVGIDVAAGMLAVARERVGAGALLIADARALPFGDASFDCILNTYTFEVLPEEDIGLVIAECSRVLRPGGRLVAVNLTEGEAADVAMIDDWKRRYADDPEYFGGARPLLLQPMLEAHAFERVTRRYVGTEWPSEVLLAYRPHD
ncbi:MAG TPA: methyltransferase domain-containing protein [Dehalococcoidia bacterium]|nr:methyltransferase domain-containing protein [Dehalococcoidia bacterium]